MYPDYYATADYLTQAENTAAASSDSVFGVLLALGLAGIVLAIVVCMLVIFLIGLAFLKSGKALGMSLDAECGMGVIFAGISLGLAFFCLLPLGGFYQFLAWAFSLVFQGSAKGYVKREMQ